MVSRLGFLLSLYLCLSIAAHAAQEPTIGSTTQLLAAGTTEASGNTSVAAGAGAGAPSLRPEITLPGGAATPVNRSKAGASVSVPGGNSAASSSAVSSGSTTGVSTDPSGKTVTTTKTTTTVTTTTTYTSPTAANPTVSRATLTPASPSNKVGTQGIVAAGKTQGHQPGFLVRSLGGAVTDVAHATVSLVGATIINQSPDLPVDEATNPEWPFKEPHRQVLYTVTWADGSTGRINKLPNGSYQILGSGRYYSLEPTGGGSYIMAGDYGNMATVSPRMGGGYTIINADGSVKQVVPREGGGYVIEGSQGVTATIMPGPGPKPKKHIFGGNHYSSGFLE